MKLKITRKQYDKAFSDRGLFGVAEATAEVLDLEFLAEPEPKAEPSWPARLEVYWSKGEIGGPSLSSTGDFPWWIDASMLRLDPEERSRFRELVARYNAMERVLEPGRGIDHKGNIEAILDQERERLAP